MKQMITDLIKWTKHSWKYDKAELVEVYGGFGLVVLVFVMIFFVVLPMFG